MVDVDRRERQAMRPGEARQITQPGGTGAGAHEQDLDEQVVPMCANRPVIEVAALGDGFAVQESRQEGLFERFGADTQSLASNIGALSYSSWNVGGNVYISQLDVLTFTAAIVVLGVLQGMLSYTGLGRAIRATADDPGTVDLIGIDSRAVYSAASAIAMVLIAFAGVFLAMRATFTPYAGSSQLLFAFETVVIGGVGSLWGTLLGGIVLGLAQSIGAQINPIGFQIAGHAVFLVILIARVYAGEFKSLGIRWSMPRSERPKGVSA